MADDDSSDSALGISPFFVPQFDADKALVALRRELRTIAPLAERGSSYEMAGKPVVMLALSAAGSVVEGRIARRAESRPEWDVSLIKSSADQRKFLDAVRQRMRRWSSDD